MRNKTPFFSNKRRICIICEGHEEYEYLEKLKSLNVWNSKYEITHINAESNGNIPARYQDKYQNNSYDVVLVFCDTDKKPYEQYSDIKRKIDELHGIDDVANNVIIFGNPCTMQIIILHWMNITLDSHKKKKNALIIEEATGIIGYKAKKKQREQLFEGINNNNYLVMKERVKNLINDDTYIGSSNFIKLIEWFSDKDDNWIKELNEKL